VCIHVYTCACKFVFVVLMHRFVWSSFLALTHIVQAHACVRVHARAHTQAYSHTRSHTHEHIHRTRTRTHVTTHKHTHTLSHTHSLSHTHTHTHSCTCTCPRTRTNTRTHIPEDPCEGTYSVWCRLSPSYCFLCIHPSPPSLPAASICTNSVGFWCLEWIVPAFFLALIYTNTDTHILFTDSCVGSTWAFGVSDGFFAFPAHACCGE